MKDSNKKDILNAVIIGYRKAITDRYQYDKILAKYEVSPYFDEAKVAEFRAYFLNELYPSPAKREELNEAFASLDRFIKAPEKMLRLVADSAGLLFKYGRHLPKIIQAGFKALRSFQAVIVFEEKIVAEAIHSGQQPPFDEQQINRFIQQLPKTAIETFITDNVSLFETLYDRKLVQKIVSIIDELIQKMRKRPTTFSPADIKGLEIGQQIIQQGDALFAAIPKAEQVKVLDLIIRIEQEVLETLFE